MSQVLVIDDEPLMLEALRRLFWPHCKVELTSSPLQALQRLSKGVAYDAVLCDLTMAELSGMELYAAIERVNPAQAERMIFLTGGPSTEEGYRFTETHAERCVGKPFDPDDLLLRVRKLAQRSRTAGPESSALEGSEANSAREAEKPA